VVKLWGVVAPEFVPTKFMTVSAPVANAVRAFAAGNLCPMRNFLQGIQKMSFRFAQNVGENELGIGISHLKTLAEKSP
jgi:hypothetical protein